jgi:hypothetical protein
MKLLLTTVRNECRYTDLALKYLYAIFTDSPIDVELKYYEMGDTDIDIYEDIVKGQYNIVYFQCDRNNDYRIATISEMVKKALPLIVTAAGGNQVSFETRKWMKENLWIDYVIRGEAETVLYRFIKSLVEYEFDFDEIGGLAYRVGDQIVVNPFDDPIDVEQLPFPYDTTEIDSDVVCYESIRGTSDRTVYTQHMPDARVRALPLSRVFTELRYFIVREVKKVVFLDRWFNYSSERAYSIFEYLINNENGITTYEFDIYGDNIDDETIRLLADAREGMFIFNLDIASINDEVLNAIGRKENIYQMMYNVTRLLQYRKVTINLSVTAGLPLETEQMFANSFNRVYGLGEGMPVRIDTLKMARGTLLSAEADRYGYVYKSSSPYDVISNKHMDSQTLIRIRTMSRIVEYYIGDGAFRLSIPKILKDTGLKPYDLFRTLTKYIYRNGLDTRMGRKEDLVRILYAYAETQYESKEDPYMLRELKDTMMTDLARLIPDGDISRFETEGWDIE